MSVLASPQEGLKLADGRVVLPSGKIINPNAPEQEHDEDDDGQTFKLVEVPNNKEAQELVVATRRKLTDLPALPRTMNAISAVLSYTLFGLSDDEIALATDLTIDQLANIRKQEAYSKMLDTVVSSILARESDDVRDMIAQQSRNSMQVMVGALKGKKVGGLQFAAAKDLLDRAGHRPADVVEHRHKLEGGLIIEVIRKDETQQLPTIDMEIL